MPLLQSTNLVPNTPSIQAARKPVLTASTRLDDAVACFIKHGVAFLDTKDEVTAPWDNMKEIFNNLDQDTINLVNSYYDEKKIIKSGFEEGQGVDIDKKIAFDISPARLTALELSGILERFPDFSQMMEYFSKAEKVAMSALSCLASCMGESSLFQLTNTNFRMIDYPAGQGSCKPHRDFGLLTLIQQDDVGGLEVEVEGRLIPVPPNTSVLLAGWCLHIRSNGRIPAPLHCVTAPSKRRQSAVVFLAPPKDLLLQPLLNNDSPVFRSLQVRELKEIMAKRWRYREGTLALENGEDNKTSQDEIINIFVKLE